MKIRKSILAFFQKICRFSFGDFEKEEFKKFVRMGCIFALIIGVYWTLRPLKDAIFIQLVGNFYLPYAKTVSLLVLLPIVMFYTKLLERISKEKMLVILPMFYGLMVLVFSGIIPVAQEAIENASVPSSKASFVAIKTLGYVWYFFVESFGSLLVALFWAFAANTTGPTEAKRGFPLIVAIGQIGGIIFPYTIGGLPYHLGLKTNIVSMTCLSLLIFLIIPLVHYFLKMTPSDLLKSFYEKNGSTPKSKSETGFLEGLKLMLKHRYLIGMFTVNFIYEVLMTIFDFNFKVAASSQYSGVALINYLSIYGSIVNIVSLLCLLLGISNIARFFGIDKTLTAMPLIMACALLGFITIDNLSFLFALMVGSKAINYALNSPALKQLYIPTTPDVRFKAQAWIETFGSRSSKEVGSLFNMLLGPLQSKFGAVTGRNYYLMLTAILGFPLLGLWLVVALFLGKYYLKAIEEKKTIC